MSEPIKDNVSSTPSWDRFDGGVLCVIAAFGVLQVILYQRVHDFLYDDVFYFETARSLLHGFYGFNGRPETNQPPGLPAILALLTLIRAGTHASFLRAMAIFETLGFAATYALFRLQLPRAVAASICLILISSPLYFELGTQWVANSFPLFLATTLTLAAAYELEHPSAYGGRLLRMIALALLLCASLMIASASIAFLGAIVAIIGVALVRDHQLALTRLKSYGAVLLVGIAVQGIWMHRKPAPLEWPLPGYPRPYLEQLKVKFGNYPELGMATAVDIPVRIARNLYDESVLLTHLLYPRWVNEHWASMLIAGPLLLVVLGWGRTLWRASGGSLLECYFAGYQAICLLWPWKIDVRYFLPIAPLACFYLWHGAKELGPLIRSRPRMIGFLWLPLGIFLTAGAWFWERGAWIGRNTVLHGGLQDELSLAVWACSIVVAGRMAWTGRSVTAPAGLGSRCFARPARLLRVDQRRLVQLFGAAIVLGVITLGFIGELEIGRNNLNYNAASKGAPADAEAGLWIHSNTASNAVVMAVQVPTVYYYAERKVVWFPPSTNESLLMKGIAEHRVQYVVVVKRLRPYYLPDDEDCFASVYKAHPSAFQLVANNPQFRIFQVVARGTELTKDLSENSLTVKTFSQ